MQAVLLGVSFALLSVIWFPTPYALAEDTRVARGTVVAITGTSLTVKVRDEQMTFNVDSKTLVEARGAGTKSRAAQASGTPGVKLADVLKVGQSVAVTYHEMDGVRHASAVRAVTAAASAGAPHSSEPESMVSNGTVQSVTSSAITITAPVAAAPRSRRRSRSTSARRCSRKARARRRPRGAGGCRSTSS